MLRIHILLFPGVTQLDFTGPAQVFAASRSCELTFVAPSLDPIETDAGFSVLPTATLADATQADVVVVPGGSGTFHVLTDAEIISWLRSHADNGALMTSVCTGAFLLGAAGLLQGRRATTHWASLPMLAEFGAQPVTERVVTDGVVTAAGVASGIDFALTLLSERLGDDIARRTQMMIEYDPQPPFDAGHPDRPDADASAAAWARDNARNERLGLVQAAALQLDA